MTLELKLTSQEFSKTMTEPGPDQMGISEIFKGVVNGVLEKSPLAEALEAELTRPFKFSPGSVVGKVALLFKTDMLNRQ